LDRLTKFVQGVSAGQTYRIEQGFSEKARNKSPELLVNWIFNIRTFLTTTGLPTIHKGRDFFQRFVFSFKFKLAYSQLLNNFYII